MKYPDPVFPFVFLEIFFISYRLQFAYLNRVKIFLKLQLFVVHIFKNTTFSGISHAYIETKYQLPQHSMCRHGQSKSMVQGTNVNFGSMQKKEKEKKYFDLFVYRCICQCSKINKYVPFCEMHIGTPKKDLGLFQFCKEDPVFSRRFFQQFYPLFLGQTQFYTSTSKYVA